jgi:hypothetical protein
MATATKKLGDVMANDTNKVLEQVMQPVAEAQKTVRAAAEKGLTEARAQFESAKTITEGNSKALGTTLEIVAKGTNELSAKALSAFQANTAALFDFATAFFAVKTPSEALEVQTAHARKLIEASTAQSKEIATLAQKIGTSAADVLKTVKAPITTAKAA